MRVIVAGSRHISDDEYETVCAAIEASGFQVDEVVSGGARGVDSLGERWAKENGKPVSVFPAEWDLHGRGAGPIRNRLMAEKADALVAVWDGKSRGTRHMIDVAIARGLPVHVCRYPQEEP